MKTYKLTQKPIAIQHFTAYIAMCVFEVSHGIEVTVKTAAIMGEERTAYVWCKIRYDKNGAAYFLRLGERYYLHDMMKF